MIKLNITNITDELFALTALRSRITETTELPLILSRDRLPALRILVRSAFSKLTATLLPYITDVATDATNIAAEQPYSTAEPLPLEIDFGEYTASLPAGSLLILRRQLEHLLAMMTLAAIFDRENALDKEIESLFESVISFLRVDSAPSPLSLRQYI